MRVDTRETSSARQPGIIVSVLMAWRRGGRAVYARGRRRIFLTILTALVMIRLDVSIWIARARRADQQSRFFRFLAFCGK